jgi:hypothetical protein
LHPIARPATTIFLFLRRHYRNRRLSNKNLLVNVS